MNYLNPNFSRYQKKKIIIGEKSNNQTQEFFVCQTTSENFLKEKISFGFPGYPDTDIQEVKFFSRSMEGQSVDSIHLDLNSAKSSSVEKEHSIFFPESPENFFEISKEPRKEIKEKNNLSSFKNPYTLFTFKIYMADRFQEFKGDFSTNKVSSDSYGFGMLITIVISLWKITQGMIGEITKKSRFLLKKGNNFFFLFLVILTSKISGFSFLTLWNFIFPFIFYRFIFNRIIGFWKKAENTGKLKKIETKFDRVYKAFLIFEVFLNGLIRTSNILSV